MTPNHKAETGPAEGLEPFMELLEGIPQKPGQKRRPAIRANIEKFIGSLSELTGWPTANFDVRTLNSNQQTSRARGESIHGKVSRDLADDRWVFIARITSNTSDHISIFNNFRKNLAPIASIAVLAVDKPAWRAFKILYRPEFKATAAQIAAYLGVNDKDFVAFEEADIRRKSAGSEQVQITLPSFSDAEDSFLSDDEFEEIVLIWKRKKNLILTGPPGVGKTFIIQSLARAITNSSDEKYLKVVQFHQSTSYEDFIRGWRPVESQPGFSLVDGAFVQFCERARLDPLQAYVFAIDEINRANLSRVFGELLMLVEADKRTHQNSIQLAYRHKDDPDETFYVPPNVFIIGTMNTADRSLAIVDTAMRRRFAFYKLKPQFESEQFSDLLRERGVSDDVVSAIKSRISALNKLIAADTRSLGEGFEIGHSFFCPAYPVEDSQSWYFSVIRSEIAPLLSEYWFDDLKAASIQVDILMSDIQSVTGNASVAVNDAVDSSVE